MKEKMLRSIWLRVCMIAAVVTTAFAGTAWAEIHPITVELEGFKATSGQIDKMIELIKTKFASYLGRIPECDELLGNLYRIKNEVLEKEKEMKYIKSQQEKELEKNDVKVKKRGEYPVN